MPKRKRRDGDNSVQTHDKKAKLCFDHDFSLLSDELVLKVLSYLPVSELAVCQRLCRRFQRLASDSEIWKEKYYARWVRPRALRIPGLRDEIGSSETFRYSSKLARWLDDGHLIEKGRSTDWNRQYRLRDNWCRGHCKVREVEVAEPPAPPVLVKVYRGITFTASAKNGLRAWTTKKDPLLISSLALKGNMVGGSVDCDPTSLGINTSFATPIDVCVGFGDGSLKIYQLDRGKFCLRYAHAPSRNGAISAVALFHPYVLTMSEKRILSLYRFESGENGSTKLPDPQLLASLESSCVYSPVSLSIRLSSGRLVASIVYAFARLSSGWSVGLQELRMTADGTAWDSRLTASIEASASSFQPIKNHDAALSARSATSQSVVLPPQSMARPTALSYSHPYLLASLPDNTLMTFLVMSNADKLEITPGQRLWGHTSSVSGVQVSDRGRAVSVSTRGNEIRVWELEDIFWFPFPRRTSVCIQPKKQDLGIISEAINRRGDGLGLAHHDMQTEWPVMRSWVGFDEEQVVVLGEHGRRQILSCYDFT